MERCGFFDANLVGEEYDRVYLASQFAAYFASFIGNGVYASKSDKLQVVEQDLQGMAVNVLGGQGWINGYWYENTESISLVIDVADGVLNRVDSVVLRLGFSERNIWVAVKKGTPAASPSAPALTRNADYYELQLATIDVPAGSVKITQAQITDTRMNQNVCGWVTGVVDQLDTTTLFNQFDAWYNEQTASWQEQFDTWFETIKGQLDEDAAGNLLNKIEKVESDLNGAISVRNLKTYTSLSQLGTNLNDITTWLGLLPSDSQLVYAVNNSEKDVLYNKGLIPINSGGTISVTNYNNRGNIMFISDNGEVYVGASSNMQNTKHTWRKIDAYIKLTGTLTAGKTTITLTDNAITTDSKFDFYTSIYGVSPTNVTVAAGSITLTFDAQETNMNVEVRVM